MIAETQITTNITLGVKKLVPFSEKGALPIDYKDVRTLQKFISERGKIIPSRITAVSTKKQRELSNSNKTSQIFRFVTLRS